MAQRLVRAKRKIKARRHPVPRAARPPAARPARRRARVVYLIFNEGYGRPRGDLAAEAIRLGRALAELMPDEPEVHGLLALMLLHDARREARFRDGELVLLADQDRALWDAAQIAAGRAALDRALALRGRGPYVVQAAIAVAARRRAARLAADRRALRRARAAHRLAGGRAEPGGRGRRGRRARGRPRDRRRASTLDDYRYLHATRGELLRRLGRADEARDGLRPRARARARRRRAAAARAPPGRARDEICWRRMSANALRWDGAPGHYEVYYLTSPTATGIGLWIRYTLLAPDRGARDVRAVVLAMDRDGAPRRAQGDAPDRRAAGPRDPFGLPIGDAELRDDGMGGAVGDASWELSGSPGPAVRHVHPLLERARSRQDDLVAARIPTSRCRGTVAHRRARDRARGARGGQAHLWGRSTPRAGPGRIATTSPDAAPRPELRRRASACSCRASAASWGRARRSSGASTASLRSRPTRSRVVRQRRAVRPHRLAVRRAATATRRLVARSTAPRASLVGVTYHDPDGEPAYCYNSEVADMHVDVHAPRGPALEAGRHAPRRRPRPLRVRPARSRARRQRADLSA